MRSPTTRRIDRVIRDTFKRVGNSHCPTCFVATVRAECQQLGFEPSTGDIAGRVPRALHLTPRAAVMWARFSTSH
jgi:hypothetical protein